MTKLDERYRSRFEMGLTVDVKAPTYETRMAILRSKVEMENIQRIPYLVIGSMLLQNHLYNIKPQSAATRLPAA